MFYPAIVTPEDGVLVVRFPHAPGCVTQVDADDDMLARASEALAGWIEASLDAGDVVTAPHSRARAPRGSRTIMVPVLPPAIALRVQLRQARTDAGVSLTAFALRLGVSLRVLQKLERGLANPTMATLDRVMAALNRTSVGALVREGEGAAAYGANTRTRRVKRRGGRRPA